MPYRDSAGRITACVTIAWTDRGLEPADSGFTLTCIQCGTVQTVTHAGRTILAQRQAGRPEAPQQAAVPEARRAIDELATDLMP